MVKQQQIPDGYSVHELATEADAITALECLYEMVKSMGVPTDLLSMVRAQRVLERARGLR